MSENIHRTARPAIGLLTSIVHQPFWLGVADAARERHVNVFCFIGGALPTHGQPVLRVPYLRTLPAQRFFSLANSARLCGLITWGGSGVGFSMNLDRCEMEEFIAPYRWLPIVNYEGYIEGIPSIVTDTRQGMRALIAHMIEHHQRRRIAFIRGPERHLESEERFLAYQETLRQYGIPFDPTLVYHGYQWGKIVGIEAVHTLVDRRHLRPSTDFDAIVGSEIEYAIGALQTLQGYGTRVPDDVAVAGFNDHLDAQTLELPISVVAKPFYEAGTVAVRVLLDLIDGKTVPDRTEVPARLVVRRSCGCWSIDHPTSQSQQTPVGDEAIACSPTQSRSLIDLLIAQIVRLRESMRPAIECAWFDGLIEGVSAIECEQSNRGREQFWSVFEEDLARRRVHQETVQWHDLVSELYYLITSLLDHSDRLSQTNLLFLQRVRLALMQERERTRIELRIRTLEQFHALLELSQTLITAQDFDHFLDVLVHRLQEVPIRECYLVLFNDSSFAATTLPAVPENSRVVLALQDYQRLPLPPEGLHFPSLQILPDASISEQQPCALMITPLFFGLRDFGYMVVQVGPREGRVYQMLSQQVSSGLQSVFLWRDYRQSEYARRESEARLHTLVEHMPIALWAKDLDGRHIMQNSLMRTLLGSNAEADREDTIDTVHSEWTVYEAWALEGRTISFEHPLLVEGRLRLFKQIIAPVRVDGAVTAILGLMFDITEQRNVEESLRSAKEAAEEARRAAESASRAKSIFLSNISHELRTPLNSILGYAQILYHDPTTPDHQRKSLQVIRSSGEHLLNLIDDLLDLAKAEAGKLRLQPAPFDIAAMLATISDMMQERVDAKQLAFVQEIGYLPHRVVTGDQRRLWQVLINLLSNAIKFTHQGTITLRVSMIPDGQDRIRFEIIDTGIGISPEYLAIIFRPFEQVNAQTSEKGTGLGLTISYELVALMGGTLQVESTLGAGSRFWFDIPLPAAQCELPHVSSAERQIIGIVGPAPKVLIVDDHPDNRAILSRMLQSLGIITAEACDGIDGMLQLDTFHPDAIILDLIMPRLNGLDMIRRIRGSTACDHIVLIVSSASAYPADRLQSLDAGAQAFIPKPIDRTVLIETLRHHLPWVAWRYAESSAALSARDGYTLPPDETMAALIELARIGDIDAIQHAIDALVRSTPQTTPFARRVRYYLETFQIGQLHEFLKRARIAS